MHALTQAARTASTSLRWRRVRRWGATSACRRRSWAEWTPPPYGSPPAACSATPTCVCTTARSSACTSDGRRDEPSAEHDPRRPDHENKTSHARNNEVTPSGWCILGDRSFSLCLSWRASSKPKKLSHEEPNSNLASWIENRSITCETG